jgi:Ricin-type beta-trefoil lectin domain-like
MQPSRRSAHAVLLVLLAAAAAQAQVDVTTHHNDILRTGANLNETVLTPADVNATTFGKLYSIPLDGQVYAQPLYVSKLTTSGTATHNVVFVATMHNSVYAFDADSGLQLWHANFGTPVHPCDVEWHENVTQGSSIGILSTPVIDPSTDTIYFVSRNEGSFDPSKCNWLPNGRGVLTGVNQGVFTHYLNALDIRTGAPKFGSPVLITAKYQSADGTLTFDPSIHNQRAALTLSKGTVYIAYASHDDLGTYHGWILGYSAATLQQQYRYGDTTSGTKGGIWQAGSALTVDGSGNLYASTGNGAFGASAAGVIQTGNSFIKLSPALALLDYFTPSNSATLNSEDADLGSSGLLAIPGTTLLFGGGKQGRAYLVDETNMGKFNASTDKVKQEFQAIFGNGTQHIHGTPVYFNSATAGPLLYVWGENDFLRAYSFNATTQLISATARAKSTMTAPETNNFSAMPGGFLSISANGTKNGIIWASTPYNADASQASVQGVVRAFDALSLNELWNDKMNDARDDIGTFAKFVPPTIANGKVFVPSFGIKGSPDGSGALNVYGLIAGASSSAPLVANGVYEIVSRHSGLVVDDPALSNVAGTVQEQWTNNTGLNQKWKLTNVGINTVSLVSQQSHMALDVQNSSTNSSAPVVQNPYTGVPSQLWTVVAVDTGFFKLVNANSGQVLDVDGGTITAGTKLDQYPYQGTAWQQWSFR